MIEVLPHMTWETIQPYWTYALFTALSVFFYVTRKRPRFLLTQWFVGFLAGIVVAVVGVISGGSVVASLFSALVPVVFLVMLVLAGRGFDKFVVNTLMVNVAIVPLPYSFYGIILTLVLVVAYAILRSDDSRNRLSLLYMVGPNIGGLIASLKDSADEVEMSGGTPVNPLLVWVMFVVPTLMVGAISAVI